MSSSHGHFFLEKNKKNHRLILKSKLTNVPWLFRIELTASSQSETMAAERTFSVSLRTLNTATVTLALGLVALAGWHVQNPSHFETIQVPSLLKMSSRQVLMPLYCPGDRRFGCRRHYV
jgi:hypothetical protein